VKLFIVEGVPTNGKAVGVYARALIIAATDEQRARRMGEMHWLEGDSKEWRIEYIGESERRIPEIIRTFWAKD
jgi:hypothetical protein